MLVQGSDCSMCKLVGLGLSLYMNERGGSAFPSIPTLAGDLSVSERTVRHHLNEHLHKQGWLSLVERGGQKGERRRANEWRATTPAGDAGVGDDPGISRRAPRQETTTTPAGGAPQVVHELEKEVEGSSLVCRECGDARFPTLDALQDHQDGACPALAADGSLTDARQALRRVGGRG